MLKARNQATHVLIVDDEKSICDILGQFLKKTGYVTSVARSGEEALEVLRGGAMDLVLSDIKMPGMSGVDLLKHMKEHGQNIPVLLTTGFPTLDTAVEALKLGAYDYLTKPFHLEEIGEKIRRALTNRRLEEENLVFANLVSLHDVTKVFSSTRELPQLRRVVVESCARFAGADGAALMLVDSSSRFHCAEAWGDSFVPGFWNEEAFCTAASWTVRHGVPLVLPAATDEWGYASSKASDVLASCMVFPLLTPQRAQGSLVLARSSGHSAFSELDLETIKVLASQASISLENVMLYQSIRDNYLRTVRGFARAVEAKDRYTHGHSENVMRFAVVVAEAISMAPDEIEKVKYAGLLHDIGKIGVSEAILNKPGSLTVQEFGEIKKHPELGVRIVADVPFLKSLSPYILHHHEFYNGLGYPGGLKGMEIPLGARILGVCDAYEAMTSDRPYRKAMPVEKATSILVENRGKQFDPVVADLFLDLLKKGAITRLAAE